MNKEKDMGTISSECSALANSFVESLKDAANDEDREKVISRFMKDMSAIAAPVTITTYADLMDALVVLKKVLGSKMYFSAGNSGPKFGVKFDNAAFQQFLHDWSMTCRACLSDALMEQWLSDERGKLAEIPIFPDDSESEVMEADDIAAEHEDELE